MQTSGVSHAPKAAVLSRRMTAHNSPPFDTAMEVLGAAVHTGIGVALRAAYHERRAQERDELQEAPVEPSEVMPETGVLWVDVSCAPLPGWASPAR